MPTSQGQQTQWDSPGWCQVWQDYYYDLQQIQGWGRGVWATQIKCLESLQWTTGTMNFKQHTIDRVDRLIQRRRVTTKALLNFSLAFFLRFFSYFLGGKVNERKLAWQIPLDKGMKRKKTKEESRKLLAQGKSTTATDHNLVVGCFFCIFFCSKECLKRNWPTINSR